LIGLTILIQTALGQAIVEERPDVRLPCPRKGPRLSVLNVALLMRCWRRRKWYQNGRWWYRYPNGIGRVRPEILNIAPIGFSGFGFGLFFTSIGPSFQDNESTVHAEPVEDGRGRHAVENFAPLRGRQIRRDDRRPNLGPLRDDLKDRVGLVFIRDHIAQLVDKCLAQHY
jgi:hypothetical protein